MSVSSDFQEQKSRFQWSRIAKLYTRRLRFVPADQLTKRADTLENAALYQYLAAFQSRSSEDFQQGITMALGDQRRASYLFAQDGASSGAELLRSKAVEVFLAFWLSKSSEEKKALLERSWNLTKRSLQFFHASKRFHEYAQTYNRLSAPVALSVEHDGNLGSRVRKLREATEHGRRTVAILRSVGEKTELAKALIRASIFLDALADDSSDKVKQRDYRRESRRSWDEAFKVSRSVALHEITHPLHGFQFADPGRNLQMCEEALRTVTPMKDNFALGRLMDFVAKYTFYAAESSAGGNPAVSAKEHLRALHFAEEADRHYNLINFTSPIAGVIWVHSPYTEHFLSLAKYEADLGKRALLEEKSLRSAPELLRQAKHSGIPRVLFYALYNSSKAEVAVAGKERNRQRQKRLLARALSVRIQAQQMMNQVFSSTKQENRTPNRSHPKSKERAEIVSLFHTGT